MDEKINSVVEASAGVEMGGGMKFGLAPHHRYTVECIKPDGEPRWIEDIENLVPATGVNHYLSRVYKDATNTTEVFVGLIDNSSFTGLSTADSMGGVTPHAGWVESTACYATSLRQVFNGGTVASGSLSNSSNKAVFPIVAQTTLYGAFIVVGAGSSVKGSTDGVLLGEGAFSTTRNVLNGDTVNVQVTITMTGT